VSNTPADDHAGAPSGRVRVSASFPEPPRRGAIATLVSVLLHAALIYLAIRVSAVIVEPRGGDFAEAFQQFMAGGGGGGGKGGTFIAVTPPAAPTVVPVEAPPVVTPVEVPAPKPEVSTPTEIPPPSAGAASAGAGSGGGNGGGTGTGTGTGTGSGVGPGSGGGTGGGVGTGRAGMPPEPRSLMIPPLDSPKSLRGKTAEVVFVISAEGRVENFTVTPAIADKGFAKKFDEVMRGYRFRPARDADGNAVASTFTYTFTFGAQ
jgi:protein TonB